VKHAKQRGGRSQGKRKKGSVLQREKETGIRATREGCSNFDEGKRIWGRAGSYGSYPEKGGVERDRNLKSIKFKMREIDFQTRGGGGRGELGEHRHIQA